jgi:hypothetical protein
MNKIYCGINCEAIALQLLNRDAKYVCALPELSCAVLKNCPVLCCSEQLLKRFMCVEVELYTEFVKHNYKVQ